MRYSVPTTIRRLDCDSVMRFLCMLRCVSRLSFASGETSRILFPCSDSISSLSKLASGADVDDFTIMCT